jgi:hypothetical protein
VIPQSLLGAIWVPLGPIRARRPESGSTEPPGSHLGPSGPDPGQEARKWLHRVSWKRSGASRARAIPELSNAIFFTPLDYWIHTIHSMTRHTQATRLLAPHGPLARRPHDCIPHAGHTIERRLHDVPIPPAPFTMCFKTIVLWFVVLPLNAQCPLFGTTHTCCTLPTMTHRHNLLNPKRPFQPSTLERSTCFL